MFRFATFVLQAYLLATDDVSKVSTWICLAMLGIVWLPRRTQAPAGPVAVE